MTAPTRLPDNFTAAANGDADAQEAMCMAMLADQPLATQPEAIIAVAFMWASMAFTCGSQSIRPTRINLLVTMAQRSVAAGDPPSVAQGFLKDALAHLVDLDREGDPDAQPYLHDLLALIAATPSMGDPQALVEQGRELATRRAKTVAALTNTAAQAARGVAVTVH